MTDFIPSQRLAAAAAGLVAVSALLAGCSTTTNLTAPVENRSSYSTGASAGERMPLSPTISGSVVDSGRVHTVAPGDTLYNISLRYGVEPSALAGLNAITDPTQLRIGQPLHVPVSTKPPVETGDSDVRVTRLDATGATQDRAPEAAQPSASTITNSDASEIPAPTAKPAAPVETPKKTVPGTRMLWPVNGKVIGTFAQNRMGLDISGTKGDIVVAAADGVVIFTGANVKGYGNLIIIKHDRDVVTAYGHNARMTVKTGDKVKAGQKIGELGTLNGVAQMRFEVRKGGKAVDPMPYLTPRGL